MHRGVRDVGRRGRRRLHLKTTIISERGCTRYLFILTLQMQKNNEPKITFKTVFAPPPRDCAFPYARSGFIKRRTLRISTRDRCVRICAKVDHPMRSLLNRTRSVRFLLFTQSEDVFEFQVLQIRTEPRGLRALCGA